MSPNEAPGDVVRWLQQSSADKSPDVDLDRGAFIIRRAAWEASSRFGIKDEPKNAASRRRIDLAADYLAQLRGYRAWMRERQLESGRSWNPDDLVFPAYHGGLGGRRGPPRSSAASHADAASRPGCIIAAIPMRSC